MDMKGDRMVTVYDVPPDRLISEVSKELKAMGIKEPSFIKNVKSGSSRERKPQQEDFWYIRLASLLRRAYTHNIVGVNSLRAHYGSKVKHRRKPPRFRKAGGSIIRKGLMELEKAGLMIKMKKGRVISPKGRALLDAKAKKVWDDINARNE